ncbi:uroporphyrinogen-III synthase [Acidihalobacter prosperus]|uniref:Uroporphyrinogen-III synthase n=1 Tax=Acidihalobacter prosperus TaxID=160660 RepID=A0A1A6C4U9_9GAMM|nr:uroporphyrinogen-III synthase [Acidihalobacter prosperus]OBS09587.1 uroporphyrinogen III methyltransferase [Acidihalobacter prosperus]
MAMPAPMSDRPLSHLGVVITRPAHQAETLCARIEDAGGRAIRFPVLEILDPIDRAPLIRQIDQLETFDLAIFISPNAVHKVMNLVKARRSWPANVRIAAIGAKSARALEQSGLTVDIRPGRRFDSEALLEAPELQDMAGRRVIIFRGDGGREMLGDTLRARGAEVVYANAYRREKPSGDNGALLYHWSRGEVGVVMVTSAEGLHNLFDMVGKLGQMWLRKTPLILGSARLAETARELGHQLPPIVAEDPSDEAMFDALSNWASHRDAT